jgi:3'-5' exoribonuclease
LNIINSIFCGALCSEKFDFGYNILVKEKGSEMERISVKDLVPKKEVESVYFVKYIAVAQARDGKKYLNVILSDSTGDLECRSWNNAEQIESEVEKGSFVCVKGKTNIYQGRKQFILQTINKIPKSDVNMDDFILKAKRNPEDMYTELFNIVEGLSDVYIRDLLKNILSDNEIQRRLKKWQAGKTIHHAYQSGLIEHILSCASLAVKLSPLYEVNVNYVVAGAILHDLCKIYELTDDINVEYTEEGKLIGHLVKGLEVVDRFSYRIKDFPYQTKMHIKHILLSHHGEYAYGSPKIPQTSEAMLVHMIDLMDSKMHTFKTIKRTDSNTGHWSGFVKHLDRIVYKDELPFHSEYLEQDPKQQVSTDPKNDSKKKVTPKPSKEIKGAMADALKGFKV